MLPTLYRHITNTHVEDNMEYHTLGRLRARLGWFPIPVRIALWWING